MRAEVAPTESKTHPVARTNCFLCLAQSFLCAHRWPGYAGRLPRAGGPRRIRELPQARIDVLIIAADHSPRGCQHRPRASALPLPCRRGYRQWSLPSWVPRVQPNAEGLVRKRCARSATGVSQSEIESWSNRHQEMVMRGHVGGARASLRSDDVRLMCAINWMRELRRDLQGRAGRTGEKMMTSG